MELSDRHNAGNHTDTSQALQLAFTSNIRMEKFRNLLGSSCRTFSSVYIEWCREREKKKKQSGFGEPVPTGASGQEGELDVVFDVLYCAS